jgi:hypothetical protein
MHYVGFVEAEAICPITHNGERRDAEIHLFVETTGLVCADAPTSGPETVMGPRMEPYPRVHLVSGIHKKLA